MTDKPQTIPPKGISDETWEWWQELIKEMKKGNWAKVKELGKRWSGEAVEDYT
jgi:hypothetical protein